MSEAYGFSLKNFWNNPGIRTGFIYGKDGQREKEGNYVQTGYYLFRKKLQVRVKYDT